MISESSLCDASDVSLLEQLRGGDTDAYTELWRRHVQAALRLARGLAPGQAEDLVSDAFLSVYRQVTTTSSGPRDAFRAYLFTVIRNSAHQWISRNRLVDTVDEIEDVELVDGLRAVEDRAASAELLSAFEALPPRWQRVLWLSEVDDVSRPTIAEDLGIKPNAVSALHRRARHGLRQQWLLQKIPTELRDDRGHIVFLLPELYAKRQDHPLSRDMLRHLDECDRCAELQRELREASRGMQKGTLAVAGFAALGVSLPAAAHLPIAATSAVAALSWLSGSTSTIAASIGIFLAGGALTTAVFIGISHVDSARERSVVTGAAPELASSQQFPSGETLGSGSASPEGSDVVGEDISESPTVGRGNTDPAVPQLEFVPFDPVAIPERPNPPQPVGVGGDPAPETPDSAVTPGFVPPAIHSGYFAPMLAGIATEGSTVTIMLDGYIYEPSVADDGSWAFDARELDLPVGDYGYTVYATLAEEVSLAETGSFTITPVTVAGLDWTAPMYASEAGTSGVVVKFTGPPGATFILVDAPIGQVAVVELDERGEALRRMRFFGPGVHFLSIGIYLDGFAGGVVQYGIVIESSQDGLPTPWSPDGDGFELSEL